MSLRVIIKKWLFKNKITDSEYAEIMNKLDGHDKILYNNAYNKALDDVRNLTFREVTYTVTYTDSLNDRTELRELIDELKKGKDQNNES